MSISRERCLEMLRELHQMRLQLDSCSDVIKDLNNNTNNSNSNTMKSSVLRRNGSVRGRRNLVKNAIRKMRHHELSSQFQPHQKGVVVYLTSCGVLRRSFDKCRAVLQLFEAFRVKFEIRDLNISTFYVAELAEKLKLCEEFQKELIFDSLPLIYVDGFFLGNEKTLVELNDAKILERILEKYKTASGTCAECGNRGYVVCRVCHGSRRRPPTSSARSPLFEGLQLRCSFCDPNGIARCPTCVVGTAT